MSRTSKPKAKPKPRSPREPGYLQQTHRPLHCLVFLLPMLAAYELGLMLLHPAAPPDDATPLVAVNLLQRFLATFGATGYHLPALAVVAILLSWQAASEEPWKISWPVVLGMTGESFLLALPLLALNQAVGRMAAPLVAADGRVHVWSEQLVLSVGAGIYEELVFRLILISALSFVLVDLARLPKGIGLGLIVVISSAAFAYQHHQPIGGEPFVAARFGFRMLAGGFLASVFLMRGFAVAVGAHAFYDIIVQTALALSAA